MLHLIYSSLWIHQLCRLRIVTMRNLQNWIYILFKSVYLYCHMRNLQNFTRNLQNFTRNLQNFTRNLQNWICSLFISVYLYFHMRNLQNPCTLPSVGNPLAHFLTSISQIFHSNLLRICTCCLYDVTLHPQACQIVPSKWRKDQRYLARFVENTLTEMIEGAIQVMSSALVDSHSSVRLNALFTIGKLCLVKNV